MKALSLSQPWCWAVMHAGKHIENRSWAPPIEMIGQQIVIHAAKSWDDKKEYRYLDEWPRTPVGYLMRLDAWDPFHFPARREMYPASAIVGIATIDRVVTKPDTLPEDQKHWFFGPYGWVLTNVINIPRPVACPGKQGLWTVPDPIVAEIREQAAA